MKINALNSILTSVVALLLATSCCWLPVLAAAFFGSAVGMAAFSEKIEPLAGVFFVVGGAAAAFGFWKIFQKNRSSKLLLESKLTCPNCGFQKTETMPTDTCQFFYECENCRSVLRPLAGDCCVFCSFGTVACPPIQLGKNCC